METMKQEITAWQEERNRQQATIHWRFTTQDAHQIKSFN